MSAGAAFFSTLPHHSSKALAVAHAAHWHWPHLTGNSKVVLVVFTGAIVGLAIELFLNWCRPQKD